MDSIQDISRRRFAATMSALAAAAPALNAADEGWVSLFDGHSLDGWRASENQGAWKVIDGCLAADGPRSHLFYQGPVSGASFRNFELEAEVMSQPLANSGIYFHTAYQEKGWPAKGFEIQVNNSATGEGAYRERKKTGSLYGVRNIYKAMANDGEWFKLHIAVRQKNVQVRLNGMLVVDYTEPTPAPAYPEGRDRAIGSGTFCLQGHDPGSKARYRNIRVRPLPHNVEQPATPAASTDAVATEILNLAARNYPMVDYHVHLKGDLDLNRALAMSRHTGIFYGIAVNCGKGFPVENEAGARAFFQSLGGAPVFAAMQAEGREWVDMFDRRTVGLFDYVFTDSMTWTDNRGRRMRTWLPKEVGAIADPLEFMDTLVRRATGILEREPIDIYVNPTFVPDIIAKDYDKLWTDERIAKVVRAAKKGGVAIEINNRYKLPGLRFLQAAKAEGLKFAFGTNNTDAKLGRCEYGLEIVKALDLKWTDFFVPPPIGERGIDRKGSILKS
jgi:hypothetical protein